MSTTPQDPPDDTSPVVTPARRVCLGPVMPVGGAESKDSEAAILTRFLKEAGGKRARILVVPTASEEAAEAGQRYTEVFTTLGAASVDVLQVVQRSDANSLAVVDQLNNATGVYITGGDQTRLVSLLVGTLVMDGLRQRNGDGVIVGGTSAGASILAAHLLIGGSETVALNSNSSAARRSMVDIGAGFGLLLDTIVDQHFSERGRIGRLLAAFAGMPGLIAIGLDEDTAVLVQPDGVLEVVGTGSVTLLNGRDTVSDYFDRKPGELLSVMHTTMYALAPGRKFNLQTHEPVAFADTAYTGPTQEQIRAASAEAAAD
jgi:cyanophycinase